MDKKQNDFFRMLSVVKQICNANVAAWSGTPSFASCYNQLVSDVIDMLPSVLAVQGGTSKGATADKKGLRKALETELGSLAASITAYALSIADSKLEDAAYLTPTALRLTRGDALIGVAERIGLLAAGVIPVPAHFNITTARINALEDAAAAFTAASRTPRNAILSKKSATETLRDLVKKGRELLKVMDGQMILFRDNAPGFYGEYQTARRLVQTGVRKRAASISVTGIAGSPLQGVRVAIEALRIRKRTGKTGACYIQHAPPGSYEVSLKMAGYAEMRVTLHINAGETARMAVRMGA